MEVQALTPNTLRLDSDLRTGMSLSGERFGTPLERHQILTKTRRRKNHDRRTEATRANDTGLGA